MAAVPNRMATALVIRLLFIMFDSSSEEEYGSFYDYGPTIPARSEVGGRISVDKEPRTRLLKYGDWVFWGVFAGDLM